MLTKHDAAFYRLALRTPRALEQFEPRRREDRQRALHDAINARGGLKHDRDMHNTLSLLRLVREREELSAYMSVTLPTSPRRAFFYRRWLRKLINQE